MEGKNGPFRLRLTGSMVAGNHSNFVGRQERKKGGKLSISMLSSSFGNALLFFCLFPANDVERKKLFDTRTLYVLQYLSDDHFFSACAYLVDSKNNNNNTVVKFFSSDG